MFRPIDPHSRPSSDAFTMLKRFSNFKVVGPAAPLVAEAGEDLVLPCSVKPSISVVGMRVEWFRLHQTDSVVHVYDGYEDSNEYQMESYRGRTALFKEELQKGNTSLKLSALRLSDEGAYKCYIESISWMFELKLQLWLRDVPVGPVKVRSTLSHLLLVALLCCTLWTEKKIPVKL
uniref:Ig-like domain-containing protein n=1 Tax=Pygocentrus nattereri TaxID=42514 RepID=A0A3B4C514_PYGNA